MSAIALDRGGRAVMVGIHDVSGGADHLVDLARRLPEPWGALVIAAGEPDAIPATVADIAASYVDRVIERVRGAEAAVVGGWGFGGLVALELRRLLGERGAATRAAFAIGTVIPRPEWRSRPTDLATMAAVYVKHIAGWAGRDVSPVLEPGLAPAAAARRCLEAHGLAVPPDDASIDRALRRFQRHVIALLDHDPGRIDGRTAVFYPVDEPKLAELRAGWDRVAPEHERLSVPGDHMSVMATGHRDAVSAALNAWLTA